MSNLKIVIHLFVFQAESPASGNFTALGIYLVSCLFFVVAAFIEFAVLLALQNSYGTKRRRRSRIVQTMQKVQEGYDEDFANVIYKIDMVSLFIFASMFALFNSLYWYTFSN